MRVFSVSQVLALNILQCNGFRKPFDRFPALKNTQIVGYGSVVPCSKFKHLLCQSEVGLRRETSGVLFEFIKDRTVVIRVSNNSNVFVVLGSRAQHSRSTYVNILYRLLKRTTLCDSRLKGIEVYNHHIYRLYSMLLHGLHMLRVVPHTEETAVDLGMQSL